MDSPGAATARAHPNIALVKYWGKRDPALNLPAAGSISITLDRLETVTRVRFDASLEGDWLVLNDRPDESRLPRVSGCLDRLRALAGDERPAEVISHNNFPTAAGLASSASGFAALVVAAGRALGLELDDTALSREARRGSGSAARSIHGGFVEMCTGPDPQGADDRAIGLLEPEAWPLEVVVAVTSRETKSRSSSDGMELSRRTSPFYRAWVQATDADLDRARAAIEERDFATLSEVAEHSCLKMHAVMLSTSPGLIYWNPATVAALHRVRDLRAEGIGVFFTVDAGPQVKAVCEPGRGPEVAAALEEVPGVREALVTGLGGPATLLDEPR